MKPFRSRSIRRQTFVLFLIGAVAPVILIGAVSIATVQEGLAQQAQEDDRAIVDTAAGLVADKMGDLIVGVELLGANPTLRGAVLGGAGPGELSVALAQVAGNQSLFSAVALADDSSHIIAGWPSSTPWLSSSDLAMQSFVQAEDLSVLSTQIFGLYAPEGGPPVIPTSTVIRDNAEGLRAIVVAFAPADVFQPLIAPIAVGSKDVFLLDELGSPIFEVQDPARDSPSRVQAADAAFAAGYPNSSFSAGSLRVGEENPQVAAYGPAPVGNTKWVLVTTHPLSAVYAQTAPMFYVSLATVAITGLVAAALARSLARRTVGPVVELTGATRDLGRARELPAQLLDRPDELGNLARSFQEMAEQVRAESQAKEELIVRLKELDRLKTSIIDTVSHELRTPITIIRGTAELMGSDPREGDRRVVTSSERIVQSADQLAYLVDELIEMSQIQAGVAAVSRTPVDVNEVVREAVRLEDGAARRQQVSVVLEADEALGMLPADRPKLRILIRNLVSNAVKFSNRGGRVTVGTGRDDARFFVRVQDEGIGISKEALEHIFDPFFQVDGSSTRSYGGAGVGLAIARNLASMHGGQLTVDSQPGKGSTFTAWIPASAGPPAGSPASAPTSGPTSGPASGPTSGPTSGPAGARASGPAK